MLSSSIDDKYPKIDKISCIIFRLIFKRQNNSEIIETIPSASKSDAAELV